MKMPPILQILSLSLATVLLPQSTLAQTGDPERESRMLMHLLKMDDAELMKLRQTVERIEIMTPQERANMRERLGKLQQMSPERRQALRERFRAIPPEKRAAMRQRWLDMSREERREMRQQLRNMSPEERAEAMEENGLQPVKRSKQGANKSPRIYE